MTPEADEAAAAWGGRLVRLIRNRENAVYEVALPRGRAALRLHRQGYQTEAAIRSELWWCHALAVAGLAVSTPLPCRDGGLLRRLEGGGLASVVAWVDGAPLGEAGRPFDAPRAVVRQHYAALGRLLAALHAVTDRLTLPDSFVRPVWNTAGLVGEAPVWGRFWEHPAATPTERAILRDARGFLQARLVREQSGDFGLIHADPLRENVFLRAGGGLALIDFDDSGFGFRTYDLGVALRQNLAEPDYQGIRDALVAGYGETRPVDVTLVEVMILARLCASVGWTMPRLASEDPTHRFAIGQAVGWAARVVSGG